MPWYKALHRPDIPPKEYEGVYLNMKLAKLLIKNLAGRAGYQVIRKPKRLRPDARFGLNVLGYLVEELLSRREAGTLSLLQVGANDGEDEDPVHVILERHTIPAILCEPIPDTFSRLKHTYTGFDHVRLARCAVASYDGVLKLHRIASNADSHRFSKITSSNYNHVQNFLRRWDLASDSIVQEIVPCKTIRSLLSTYGWQTVDIVIVDTEGMDHLICSQVLDLTPPPLVIHFEYCNSPVDSILSLIERLKTLEYRFVRSGIDITAARLGYW